MAMEAEKQTVAIDKLGSVTALLYPAAKRERAGVTIILGHGAGADQSSGFMRMAATGLAARGFDAMTFNFLYKEQGRSIPDPKARLESCYQAVIKTALTHGKLKKNRLVIGGKSMGGRIASQVAAAQPDGIAGLVFLGYPLHPPGRPDKLRDEHLKDIGAPILFVQGARDAFVTSEEIRAVIERMLLLAMSHELQGYDNAFDVAQDFGRGIGVAVTSCQFIQLDVFTDQAFCGNPLAVFPEAEGITDERMQQIAREMNLSETVFVLPSEKEEALRRLRIFTPGSELPFAGHPIVGTWNCLAREGVVPLPETGTGWVHFPLEVGIGVLPTHIE